MCAPGGGAGVADASAIMVAPAGRLWTPEGDDMVRRAFRGDGAADTPEPWTVERCARALERTVNAIRLRWTLKLENTEYATPSKGRYAGPVPDVAVAGRSTLGAQVAALGVGSEVLRERPVRRAARPREGALAEGSQGAAKRSRGAAYGGADGFTGVKRLGAGAAAAAGGGAEWEARITIKGELTSLGGYPDERSAAAAFDHATLWRVAMTPGARPPKLNLPDELSPEDAKLLAGGDMSKEDLMQHLADVFGRVDIERRARGAHRRVGRWYPDEKHAPRGLPEAPTFRPTVEEFADPVSFIMRVRSVAAPYGMARIVPPKGWAPPIALQEAIDNDAWWFPTKVQDASLLQERLPSRVAADMEAKRLQRLARAFKGHGSMSAPRPGSRRAHVIETGEVGCAKCRMAPAGCVTCRGWLAAAKEAQRRQEEASAPAAAGEGDTDKSKVDAEGKVEEREAGDAPMASAEEFRFGWGKGPTYTYNQYLEYATSFKKEYFGGEKPTLEQIEDEFWRIVEAPTEPVEVHYGNDLLTSDYGSAFPLHEDHIGWCGHNKKLAKAKPRWQGAVPYSEMPWNVMNIARWPTSVLRNIKDNVSGVVVPWLYMGSLFSAFCWHVEDQGLYSINYHHKGEPKVWYGIPEDMAHRFEEVVYNSVPALFEDEPSLMHQIVTMVSPNKLRAAGIPICRAVQEEGNFIITMPGAYHGGFNSGFNMAEAVNFGPPDWLPWGAGCLKGYYANHSKACVISHDEVVLSLAEQHAMRFAKASQGKGTRGAKASSGRGHPDESAWIAEAMAARLREEEEARAVVARAGVVCQERAMEGELHEKDCEECAADLYHSAVVWEEWVETEAGDNKQPQAQQQQRQQQQQEEEEEEDGGAKVERFDGEEQGHHTQQAHTSTPTHEWRRHYFSCEHAPLACAAYAACAAAPEHKRAPRLLYRRTLEDLRSIAAGARAAACFDAERRTGVAPGSERLVGYPSGHQCAPGPLLGFAFDQLEEGAFPVAERAELAVASPCASALDSDVDSAGADVVTQAQS